MVWYTGVDKDIYESGIHFRPQQKYLTTDYVWPTPDQGGGGGSGIPAAANYVNQDQSNYSVYNPDPNRTTLPTKYRPYDARQAHEYSFINPYRAEGEFGYDTETEMQKHMDMYPKHYYPPTNKYIEFAKNLVPSFIKAGAGIVKELLPENPGATMRNEMLGQGFAIDDIGRVVMQQTGWTTGPDGKRTFGAISATDPRNVMAGYHLTNLSEEDMASGNNPFDKRLSKLESRYAKGTISQDTYNTYKDAIEGAKQNWLNAQTNKLAIVKWKQKQKQDKRDEKIRKDLEGTGASLTDQDQITNILTTQQDDNTPTGKTDAWQETFSGTKDGGGEFAGTGQTASQKAGQSWEDSGFLADGGRVHLNLGGIASVLGREGLAPGGPAGGASAGGDYGGNVNPEQEYAGSTFEERYGDGGDGGEEPPTVVENKNNLMVDSDWLTTSPSAEIKYTPSQWAQIMARLSNKDITSTDDIDVEGQFTGGNDLINYGIDFTDEGVTGGNVGLNYGDLDLRATTDLDKYNLGVNYNKGPFFVSGNIDNMGNKNIMGGVKWEFGKPEAPEPVLSYDDLIYGQGLRHGGLASIL